MSAQQLRCQLTVLTPLRDVPRYTKNHLPESWLRSYILENSIDSLHPVNKTLDSSIGLNTVKFEEQNDIIMGSNRYALGEELELVPKLGRYLFNL